MIRVLFDNGEVHYYPSNFVFVLTAKSLLIKVPGDKGFAWQHDLRSIVDIDQVIPGVMRLDVERRRAALPREAEAAIEARG